MGAVLYSGSKEMPRCLPSSYGQTGIGSFPCAIILRSGSAAYDVGTPRVSSPSSGGKTYFSPRRRNSSSAPKFGRFFMRDNTAQRLGGVRRRDPAGEFSQFGRKNVLQPAEEEFFERAKVRAVLHARAVEQVARLSALHRSMHLRRAHHQLRGKLRVRRTIRPGCHNLERYIHILGL